MTYSKYLFFAKATLIVQWDIIKKVWVFLKEHFKCHVLYTIHLKTGLKWANQEQLLFFCKSCRAINLY